MKLLRLTSNDEEGIFNAQFNEEIVIEPKSKMALHSLSFSQIQRALTIDSDNDEITVNYKLSSPAVTATKQLTHKTYTADNVDFLLQEIQQLLNQTPLLENRNQHGLEWRVEKNQKNKIQIYYKKNPTLKEMEHAKIRNLTYVTTNNGSYHPTGGASANNYIGSTDYLPLGCGYVRAKWINKANGDVLIGLSQHNPDVEAYQIGNIKYGVFIDRANDEYKYILNGNITATGITGTNNDDVIEVAIQDGKINCNLYRVAQANVETILSVSYDNETKLYPYLVITGDNSNIVNLFYNYSPFSNVSKSKSVYIDTSNMLGVKPPSRLNTPSNQSVVFESIEVAEYLGFISTDLGTQKTTEYNITAPNLFLLNSYNDSFVVELFDLKLDSYDTQKKGRNNILAVVPSAEVNENSSASIVYEPNNLIFINLNNYDKINLRNMRLRVLQRDLTPLNIKGLAVMSLLVKDADE